MKLYSMRHLQNHSGFTLVELAVVLIIFGLMSAAALSMYTQYIHEKKIEDTANAVEAIAVAIDAYFQETGHYPCPAPQNAGIEDVNFGVAMDCTDTTAPATIRSIDLDGDGTNENARIRIGTLPFKDLSLYTDMSNFKTSRSSRLRGHEVIDVYNNLYTYVVTEQQATINYADDYGAINIIDEFDRDVADRVNFLVLSHGENGVGAHTAYGNSIGGCTGSAEEIENCDGDFQFRHALRSEVAGANYFDDEIMYLQWFPYYLWTESRVNPNAVHNKNLGDVGIGVNDPQDKLHIKDGHLQAYDISATDQGKVITDNLCKEDGSDCFDPELISGTTFPTCPPGQVMAGIQNGAPICNTTVTGDFNLSCSAPLFISRITYNAVTKTVTHSCDNPR